MAKRFVDTALNYSKDIVIGGGMQGPFDHFLSLKDPQSYRQSTFKPDDLFLYAVTDSRMNKKWNRSIVDAVKAAIEGGATIIQLRLKLELLSGFISSLIETRYNISALLQGERS